MIRLSRKSGRRDAKAGKRKQRRANTVTVKGKGRHNYEMEINFITYKKLYINHPVIQRHFQSKIVLCNQVKLLLCLKMRNLYERKDYLDVRAFHRGQCDILYVFVIIDTQQEIY